MKISIKKMLIAFIGFSAAAFCFTSCDDIPSEIYYKRAQTGNTRYETETPKTKIVCPDCSGTGCDVCDHREYTWE